VPEEATRQKGLLEALPLALYFTVQKETTAKSVWDTVVKHHHCKGNLTNLRRVISLKSSQGESKVNI
jgi:hypothetical protein